MNDPYKIRCEDCDYEGADVTPYGEGEWLCVDCIFYREAGGSDWRDSDVGF